MNDPRSELARIADEARAVRERLHELARLAAELRAELSHEPDAGEPARQLLSV